MVLTPCSRGDSLNLLVIFAQWFLQISKSCRVNGSSLSRENVIRLLVKFLKLFYFKQLENFDDYVCFRASRITITWFGYQTLLELRNWYCVVGTWFYSRNTIYSSVPFFVSKYSSSHFVTLFGNWLVVYHCCDHHLLIEYFDSLFRISW